MRIVRDMFRCFAFAALLSGVLGGAVSCTRKTLDIQEDVFQPNFRLTLEVPVETKSTSTADYGDAANNEGTDNFLNVNDLQVYFFDAAGVYVAAVTDFSDIRLEPVSSGVYNPHYHLYDAKMRVDGITGGTQYRVVVLANRRSDYVSSLPFCVRDNKDWRTTGTGDTDEQKLYSTLEYNYSSTGADGLSRYISMNFNRDDRASVPMWGVSQLVATTKFDEAGDFPGTIPSSGTINMLRSLAKVRINIAPELKQAVTLTDYDACNQTGGARLCTPVMSGYMTPAYSKVGSAFSTPDILNKDREGGSPTGRFTDEWINRGQSGSIGDEAVYPMYGKDGSYYVYLPEAYIGQAWMELEFRWTDPAFAAPTTHNYKLHFADYEQASAYYALESGIALTEEQLEDYKFPVMRNHYYIYTVTSLNPIKLKFEVCEWHIKDTSISFN